MGTGCDAHHLVSRRHIATRWLVPYGLTVCTNIHQSPWLIDKWLAENEPELYEKVIAARVKIVQKKDVDMQEVRKKLEVA